MSYNITAWNEKLVENLMIPIGSFYKSGREDWHFKKIIEDQQHVTLEGMATVISGFLRPDGYLIVSIFKCVGEGSGTEMNLIIEPALEDSKGKLIATCVWEGGESINKLIVNDGEIEWKEIDI